LIRLEGVSVTYTQGAQRQEVRAVRDVSLEVASGETLCLIGPSGCGKTTTLRLVNRMVDAGAGRVLVGGVDVADSDPIRLRRRIGYVIQSGGLFPHLDVRANIGLLCGLEEWSDTRTRERVDSLLQMVRLAPTDFADRYPAELSGGERQRVGVARALALDPDIVLMDEPFGALDPITRSDLQQEFLELSRNVDKTIVIVTHDLDEAFLLGDRIGVMSQGSLVRIGTPDDILRDPGDPEVARYLERRHHAG